MAMKMDDIATTSTSLLAARRVATATLDANENVTANKNKFILKVGQILHVHRYRTWSYQRTYAFV
jgi:hypothetical protein